MDLLKKQELLNIFKVEPRSVQDIANIAGVHYVTAHKWVKELLAAEHIQQLPFPRGKEKIYTVLSETASEDGLLRIQVDRGLKTIGDWIRVNPDKYDPYQLAQMAVAYLYRRSMKVAAGEQGGIMWSPVQVRGFVRELRDMLVTELNIVERLLLMEDVWAESSTSPHQKYGPTLEDMLDTWADPVDALLLHRRREAE